TARSRSRLIWCAARFCRLNGSKSRLFGSGATAHPASRAAAKVMVVARIARTGMSSGVTLALFLTGVLRGMPPVARYSSASFPLPALEIAFQPVEQLHRLRG